MHRFLAKIVVTNIWPQARRSELTLKKATLVYAIVIQTPFCLCKHILHTMLEVRDEKNTSLSFGCLITQICLQVVLDISDSKPRSRIPDPLGIQTLMKSNAQLRHEAQGDVPQPPPKLSPQQPHHHHLRLCLPLLTLRLLLHSSWNIIIPSWMMMMIECLCFFLFFCCSCLIFRTFLNLCWHFVYCLNTYGFNFILCYPFSLCDKKGEYFFWLYLVFRPEMYFQIGQVFLSQNGQRGSLLVFLLATFWIKQKHFM